MALLLPRIAAKIDRTPDCWVWTGASSRGYGQVSVAGRIRPAHVVVYEALVGPVGEGLQLDHLCRNRLCVNPAHLEPVTPRLNTLRNTGPSAANAVKEQCPKGHPYDEANTIRYPDGRRWCRVCNRELNRRWRERRADA
jgi:hypothetical protein